MKIKIIAAAVAAAAVLASAPVTGTLSYAEIIANAGGGESVDSGVENAPKLIVDGKEIAPDSTYEGFYNGAEADYSIKGNAAHTYKIEFKEDGVCTINFACDDSETGADSSSEYYLCEFSTTAPITLSCSEKVKLIPDDVYGGAQLELNELSGDITLLDEYETIYSLGSQTGGSGSFAFYGSSRSSTQISTTVMDFDAETAGTIELTVTAKNGSPSDPVSEPTSDPVSESTSDPASEQGNTPEGGAGNPSTGYEGAMAALGVAAIAGTFVMVSRKRK